jgi:hypothetical protein
MWNRANLKTVTFVFSGCALAVWLFGHLLCVRQSVGEQVSGREYFELAQYDQTNETAYERGHLKALDWKAMTNLDSNVAARREAAQDLDLLTGQQIQALQDERGWLDKRDAFKAARAANLFRFNLAALILAALAGLGWYLTTPRLPMPAAKPKKIKSRKKGRKPRPS